MKKKLRGAFFASFAFLILATFYPGFLFNNTKALAFATLIYALLYLFVRPVLKLFSVPLNLLTFGIFSLFVNVIVLYLLTFFVSDFKIVGFNLTGLDLIGIKTSVLEANPLISALSASTLLSILTSVFFWFFV